MSYSFKKTPFAEIFKVKRHSPPCHCPDNLSFVLGEKIIKTCDTNSVSSCTEMQEVKIPLLNLQCSHITGGSYCVFPCCVLQGC